MPSLFWASNAAVKLSNSTFKPSAMVEICFAVFSKTVVSGQVKANKAFTGPVGIANMFGAEVNWIKFWGLVGLLSMALALMNLLPIPALDGGHAVFLVIEMIKGKPLGDKFMEKAQIVGFVILVALVVFVLGNDILKYVIK